VQWGVLCLQQTLYEILIFLKNPFFPLVLSNNPHQTLIFTYFVKILKLRFLLLAHFRNLFLFSKKVDVMLRF
jgi:hypothetical protein